MAVSIGDFTLQGIGLAGIVGVILNLVLPRPPVAQGEATTIIENLDL